MRTLQTLLADRPVALAHVQSLLDKGYDVWVVGGAARALLFDCLPFPKDIDLLLNSSEEKAADAMNIREGGVDTSSNGQGQKLRLFEMREGTLVPDNLTLFDIWTHNLLTWLAGVPLRADGLAIRVSDNFVLTSGGFGVYSPAWSSTSSRFMGNQEYLKTHAQSLDRDYNLVQLARQEVVK